MSDEDEEQDEEQEEEFETNIAESTSSFAMMVWVIAFVGIGAITYLIVKFAMWLRIGMAIAVGLALASIISNAVYIVAEWEKVIVLRLGKFHKIGDSGVNFKIPIVDEIFYRDTRDRSFDLIPQKILTKDTVPTKINAVIFYKIFDAKKSVIDARDWMEMTTERAKSELRETISKRTLAELLDKREELAGEIRKELDAATDPWGIKVKEVKIKDIILPQNMERAMAKEAEASREKIARIIKADAEFEASKRFEEAAQKMSDKALILRQLQTWQEIGAEQNSLIILVPTEFASVGTSVAAATAVGQIKIPKK